MTIGIESHRDREMAKHRLRTETRLILFLVVCLASAAAAVWMGR